MTVPRDPQPPTQGTIFRRRLQALRDEMGVRCGTCQFFDDNTCSLKMEWTTEGDFCVSWQEPDTRCPICRDKGVPLVGCPECSRVSHA